MDFPSYIFTQQLKHKHSLEKHSQSISPHGDVPLPQDLTPLKQIVFSILRKDDGCGNQEIQTPKTVFTYTCNTCGRGSRARIGLISHLRKHGNQNQQNFFLILILLNLISWSSSFCKDEQQHLSAHIQW